VATLLIEGETALEVAGELLFTKSGKKPAEFPSDRPIFARFGNENGEEVVLRRRNISNRLESLELHCHGGYAAVQAIEKAFVERGFSLFSWKEWAAETTEDPFVAAARLALADARTERTAAILLDQYHGALRRAFLEIQSRMGSRHADSEKSKESGSHFVFTGKDEQATRQVGNLSYVDALLALAPLGLHLTTPWRVALVGLPNVGKSSLLNALLGYGRAIVHHTPGTTRDVIAVETAFEGWPVQLCDTAGLRHLSNESDCNAIERAGIELAKQQIALADLLLLVFDAGRPWTAADQALAMQYPQAMILHNKADLPRFSADRPAGIFVSAMTGQGVDQLPRLIAERLVPHPPPPGAAVPFTEEQVELLRGLRC
jgi:tRNA modification GTPase